MSDEVFKITTHDKDLGITTTVHSVEGRVSIEKQWDAEPILREAEAARQQTAGERWGEMRHVGFIPMAVYATFLRQDGGFDRNRLLKWLKENPAFVTFDKVLK